MLPWVFTGCATTYYHLSPTGLNPRQKTEYVQGYQLVSEMRQISENEELIVNLSGYTVGKVLRLEVLYGNNTNEYFDAVPDKIEVYGIENGRSTKIKVWQANKYIRKMEQQQNATLILLAIGGALSASQAGTSNTTTTGTYNGYSPYGSYTGTFQSNSTTYDSSKIAEANFRNEQLIQRQAMQNANNISYLRSVLLNRTTLAPRHYIGGAVFCEKKIYSSYVIFVPFGGDHFVFHFNLITE